MKTTTRVALIGVGAMGRNHARVYADMPNVDLVGVADANLEAAQAVAKRHGTEAFADVAHMLDTLKPDAVTIAVPTIYHRDVAKQAISRGIHVLIEKPIALSVDEASEIIDDADSAGVVLTVGHIERFNPAVIALKKHLADGDLGRVFQIDIRRQGPFPARIRDVGVVIDLAVHDLDIIRYISESEVVRVSAETDHQLHPDHEDTLSGLLRLSNGTIGTLAINWLTPTKIRELSVTGDRGMFRVDYLTQDLYFYENATTTGPEWETLRMLRGISEGRMVRHVVNKAEPLRAELEAFVAAVRGEAPVAISGLDGMRALELAYAVIKSGNEQSSVQIQLPVNSVRAERVRQLVY
jgi:UDP-N-acetylglucosamine 3-dehydrogenase